MPGANRQDPHFRGKAREGRRVELRFAVGAEPPRTAYTRDIGVGGAFVVTSAPAAAGIRVRLSVTLPPAGEPLEIAGEVRWSRSGGMGVKFVGMEIAQVLRLNEYLATVIGED